MNTKFIWANQTRNDNATAPPIIVDKITVQGNASYQLIHQPDSINATDQNKNITVNTSQTQGPISIIDKEYPSPIDDVNFFNEPRPGNISMYNETIVSIGFEYLN